MRAFARPAALLGAGLLLSVIAVGPSMGWNENSRYGLTMAIVDDGTFSIDSYHDSRNWGTEDKASAGGHFFSDKLIGASLLGVPGYAMARAALGDVRPAIARYAMCLFAAYVPAALGGVLFWFLLVRLGAAPRLALGITAGAFFGTMWFVYATSMYPYAAGIAAMLGAMHLVLGEARGWKTALSTGLLLGIALLMDYTFGIAIALIGASVVTRRGLGSAAVTAAGAAVPVIVFAVYCRHIFGSFSIPYEHLTNPIFREGMSKGLMGVTAPRGGAIYFLTVHPFRGLFFWQPIVALGAVGCARSFTAPGVRGTAARIGLTALVAYIVFAASYYMWWGGWAVGPRLILPAVPLAALGVGVFSGWGKRLALLIAAVSVLLMVPVSLDGPNTNPGFPEEIVASAQIGDAIPAANLYKWSSFISGKRRRASYAGFAVMSTIVVALLAIAARALPPQVQPGSAEVKIRYSRGADRGEEVT